MEALPWSGNRAWLTGWPSHGNTWQAGRVIQPISPSAQVTCQQGPPCGGTGISSSRPQAHIFSLSLSVGLLLFCSDEDGTHAWQTLFLIHPPPCLTLKVSQLYQSLPPHCRYSCVPGMAVNAGDSEEAGAGLQPPSLLCPLVDVFDSH